MKTLYIVGTPIGNLKDITLRALEVLKASDLILCEDTRVTKKLLSHYDIHTPVKRMDSHTEKSATNRIIELFEKHKTIALVSDAGTPTISDPGDRFVKAVRDTGIQVIAIPGASAVVSALSISGLPASEFLFLGFLPHKKGRETLFKEIAESKRTVVLYESPHRILKTLKSLNDNLTMYRKVVVTRELTKMYEEVISGSPDETLKYFTDNPNTIRGEFTVIISPKLK